MTSIRGRHHNHIFTPLAEVPFAGHPAVGAAIYLLHHRRAAAAHTLRTKAGPVPFRAHALGGAPAAQLAVAHDVHVHDAPFAGTRHAAHPVVSIVKGMTALLVRLPSLAALAAQTANLLGNENTYAAKDRLDAGWRAGPVVSYFYVDLGADADGVRRLRARSWGSREDPATGSMAAGLCAYLSLTEKEERVLVRRYEVTQGVEMGRRSEIRVRVTLDKEGKGVKEVLLEGNAVRVLEGKVPVPEVGMAVRSE
ncbi:hypothetical protein F4819DRAFT_483602 [Hypoxylon fuscum]|nr:hypothetical protein F4819DRAFT_483602 [Hypoxylon fuscum]